MTAIMIVLMLAQLPVFSPIVNPDMIEISFDGVSFQDATNYVSNIVISTGIATGVHITHIRRGGMMYWTAQLGTPFDTEKVEWQLDTGLIAKGHNKLYLRSEFGVEDPIGSGIYRTSGMGEPSDVVKLIGKPPKPIHVE